MPTTYQGRADDVVMVVFNDEYGPLASFIGPHADESRIGQRYYRPSFFLRVWFFDQILPPETAAIYPFVMLMIMSLSSGAFLLLYRLFQGRVGLSLLGALLFAGVRPLNESFRLASETWIELLLIVMLVVLTLYRFKDKLSWYLPFFGLLAVSFYLRENALALSGLGMAYASYLGLTKQVGWATAGKLFAVSLGSTVPYFVMRHFAMGIIPQETTFNEAGLLFRFYLPHQIALFSTTQRLLLYAYSAAANVVATFMPIFSNGGMLQVHALMTTSLLSLLGAAVLFVASRQTLTKQTLFLSGGVILIGLLAGGLGLVLFSERAISLSHVRYAAGLINAAIPSVTSLLLIGVIIWHIRYLRTDQRNILVLAVLVVLGFSVIAFPYFRYRNTLPQIIGYILIFGLAYQIAFERDELVPLQYAIVGGVFFTLLMKFFPYSI